MGGASLIVTEPQDRRIRGFAYHCERAADERWWLRGAADAPAAGGPNLLFDPLQRIPCVAIAKLEAVGRGVRSMARVGAT